MSLKRQKSTLRSSAAVPKSRPGFNPSRFTLVRKRMGMTKSELAAELGVDLRSITAYEAGEYPPGTQVLHRLSQVSKFPADFFSGDNLEEPHTDSASFRSMAKMRARHRDMALSQGAVAYLFNRWIEKHFELPKVDLPDLGNERSPEAAADSLRRYWGVGELAIRNMIHLIEAKGVRVFSLAIDAREVDAFSLWKGPTPFIFLNNKKSSERSRYDAAHELAHLVLHRHASPRGREAEREADEFASAFLMPRASVIAKSSRTPSLTDLIELKRSWTVSLAALNCRLHAVSMLSEWQYRTFCIQIASKGYRLNEPNEAPRETSLILPKVFDALRNEGITRSRVARELSVPQSELEQLVFGLAMTVVEGGRKSKTGAKAQLTLVNSTN
jgi:Zn-dependent peptidase ImmA (M78 family)/DNA-binding XRE family transcriptional regulator